MKTIILTILSLIICTNIHSQSTIIYRNIPADDLRNSPSFTLYMCGQFSIVKYSDGNIRAMLTSPNIWGFAPGRATIGFYSTTGKLINKIEYDGEPSGNDFIFYGENQHVFHTEHHEMLKEPCDCKPFTTTDLLNYIKSKTGYIRIIAELEEGTLDTSFWTMKSRKPIRK